MSSEPVLVKAVLLEPPPSVEMTDRGGTADLAQLGKLPDGTAPNEEKVDNIWSFGFGKNETAAGAAEETEKTKKKRADKSETGPDDGTEVAQKKGGGVARKTEKEVDVVDVGDGERSSSGPAVGNGEWSSSTLDCCKYPCEMMLIGFCPCYVVDYLGEKLDMKETHNCCCYFVSVLASTYCCPLNVCFDCPCGKLYVGPCYWNAIVVAASEKYNLPPPAPFGNCCTVCRSQGGKKNPGCGPQIICCSMCTIRLVYHEVAAREGK